MRAKLLSAVLATVVLLPIRVDAQAQRRARIAIRIEFADQHLSWMFMREFVDGRNHGFAGSAPVRVAVHQHGHLRVGNDAVEVLIGKAQRSIEQQLSAALAALGTVRNARQVNMIQRATERTGHSSRGHAK